MHGIKIRGTGRCVPKKTVTNADFLSIVDTNEEWIKSRTGIEKRHHIEDESHLDLCLGAAKEAIANAGISPDEIGVCIVATLTADNLVPSSACMLQRELKMCEDSVCFDLNAACTGFIYALHTAECLLNASKKKYGLVIGCECLSKITNWDDRSTCILFGDGAGAVVVECDEAYSSINAVIGCRGDNEMLHVDGVGKDKKQLISMQGQAVFRFAVATVPACIDKLLSNSNKTIEDVDFFVFHQANARIIDLAVRKYKIPQDKYYKNICDYGNTSAASIPIVISELWDLKKVHSGSRVLVVGFGGGLTWGGALIEFA